MCRINFCDWKINNSEAEIDIVAESKSMFVDKMFSETIFCPALQNID